MAIKSSDQISIVDLTDGYSVILTNDSFTFLGDTSHAIASSTTTTVIAMCGGSQVAASVNLDNVVKPAGVTVTKDNNATQPTLTIAVANTVTAGGTVDIPISLDNGNITIHKYFTFQIAFTGATGGTGPQGPKGDDGDDGKGVSSVTITYQAGSSNSTAPTGTWQNNPPTVSEGQYLWTKIVFGYTDGTSSSPMYSVAKQGVSGSSSQWYTGTAITGTSTTATTFSGSGISAAKVGDMYLNTSTQNTYRCTVAGNASTAKWVYVSNIKGATGGTGPAGADAITMSITSSAGTIFKNSAISTTLTAHVYKAGVELTSSQIAALGTIKWYKDGSSTALSTTGPTLTISAGDVTNKASYIAQLEG